MFKNDERYWDINLLNKWFAISSIVFLVVMVWVFIDDNDDEFKEYQKEFRKLQIEITKEKVFSFLTAFQNVSPIETKKKPVKKASSPTQKP